MAIHLRAVLPSRAAWLLVFVLPMFTIAEHDLLSQEPQEDRRARAERLADEASALTKRGDSPSMNQALPLRQEALALWIELGDRPRQADAYLAIGISSEPFG